MKKFKIFCIFLSYILFLIGAVSFDLKGETILKLSLLILTFVVFLGAAGAFKEKKILAHSLFNNKQNYELLDGKIIVWHDLRDYSTEYDNCKQENYFFIGQGLHVTSIAPSNDPDDVKVVSIETSIGQWNPKVLPNLVEAFYIIDELVIRNTQQDVLGYLKVSMLFVDYDNEVRVLQLEQTLSYYGVDDYRVYKRELDEVNITKHQFLYTRHNSDYSKNQYGMITDIYDWAH